MKEILAEAYAADCDAVVAGVRCRTLPLAEPWATQARPVGPVPDLGPVREWLGERSPQWTVAVPDWLTDRPEYAGLVPWTTMPMYVLDGTPVAKPVPGLEVGPARDVAEFVSIYGENLAPLVTPERLADPALHHLVGRLDGHSVGTAKLAVAGGTAYVSAVNVLPEYRGKGIGTVLSATASRLGQELAGIVWLHAADLARPLYERIGYRFVGEHVLLTQA